MLPPGGRSRSALQLETRSWCSVPGTVPVLPAIIVAQTLVELVSELVYVRLVPKMGERKSATSSQMR